MDGVPGAANMGDGWNSWLPRHSCAMCRPERKHSMNSTSRNRIATESVRGGVSTAPQIEQERGRAAPLRDGPREHTYQEKDKSCMSRSEPKVKAHTLLQYIPADGKKKHALMLLPNQYAQMLTACPVCCS